MLAFSYRPGRTTYDYTATGSVTMVGDTAQAERVNSRAIITLQVPEGGVERPVLVIVDSFVVASTSRIAPNEQRLGMVRVSGMLGPRPNAVRFDADSADCSSPAGAIRLLAHDVFVPVPDSLTAGRQWSDTTESVTCRGGARLHSRTISTYRVEAL
jgi:hypothetical protein